MNFDPTQPAQVLPPGATSAPPQGCETHLLFRHYGGRWGVTVRVRLWAYGYEVQTFTRCSHPFRTRLSASRGGLALVAGAQQRTRGLLVYDIVVGRLGPVLTGEN